MLNATFAPFKATHASHPILARPGRRRTHRTVCMASSIPKGPNEMVQQAAQAAKAAYEQGIRLHKLELLLPLIGATDLDDWPGGIRQQFQAAQPLVEQIIRRLKLVEGLEGALTPEVWDDGDAVVAYCSPNLAAVVFPTSYSLEKLRALVQKQGGPKMVVVVNPQWQLSGGQLISELGFGARRKQNEELIASLHNTYSLKQIRILGDDIRVLRTFPDQWQVFLVDKRGAAEQVAELDTQPTYKQLEDVLRGREGSAMNKSLFERLRDELKFNADSLKG